MSYSCYSHIVQTDAAWSVGMRMASPSSRLNSGSRASTAANASALMRSTSQLGGANRGRCPAPPFEGAAIATIRDGRRNRPATARRGGGSNSL